MCLGNISKDFTANNKKIYEKAGLNGYVYDFSVDYNIIDPSNITNVHKYLIKKHNVTVPILEFKGNLRHVQKVYPTLVTQVDLILQD